MELIFTIILLLFGIIIIFLYSTLSGISYERLNEIEIISSKLSDKLHDLRMNIEIYIYSFFVLNLIFNIAGFLYLYIFLINLLISSYIINIILILTFIAIILFSLLIISFLKKYSNKFSISFLQFICTTSIVIIPVKSIILFIENIIIGKEIEEDSRNEISALVETAHEEGSLDAGEYRILTNIMHFNEVMVSDVMTPRTVITSLNANTTVEEALKYQELQMYSRIPIWESESLDEGVLGYVLSKDIYYEALKGNMKTPIRKFLRDIFFIPENASLADSLELFLLKHEHLSLVVDEYGGIEGLLSMEDVVETILGVEIVDEADKIADLRELAKQSRDKRIATITILNK
jgi:CBS domain containing-hemolysin-like protein